MTKTPRTPHEYQRAYQHQLLQLTNRCDQYQENGAFYEAYSIATIVRVLVHDTGSSTSLLKQLGTKDNTRFLDSRSTGNLYMMGIMNGYGGLCPRTRTPHKQYSEKNNFTFDEWWEGQEFNVRGATFNRKSLITSLANQEGGAHVDPKTDVRLAAINRSESPYHMIDGDETSPMYGAELASCCAIGEEILFSLTPEPENRKRMLFEPWQKPFYLSKAESDAYKETMRREIADLEKLLDNDIEKHQKTYVKIALRNLNKVLDIDKLTSVDCEVLDGISYLMNEADIPWKSNE